MRIAVWVFVAAAVAAVVGAIAWADSPAGTGTVIISCNEDDAELIVDGVLIPDRTPAVLVLPTGTHVIEVRKSPFVPQQRSVQVGEQQQVKVRIDLVTPTPAPGLGEGSGSGGGSGSGSGSGIGVGSAGVGSAGVGSAASGSAAPVEIHPASGVATLEIATTVQHAIAFVDGVAAHEAPCTLELEPGEHVIAVYAPGMVPRETNMNLDVGARQHVELNPTKHRQRIDVPAQ